MTTCRARTALVSGLPQRARTKEFSLALVSKTKGRGAGARSGGRSSRTTDSRNTRPAGSHGRRRHDNSTQAQAPTRQPRRPWAQEARRGHGREGHGQGRQETRDGQARAEAAGAEGAVAAPRAAAAAAPPPRTAEA